MSDSLTCELCWDKPSFSRKYTLRRHIVSKHEDSSTFFECAVCGSRCKRKDSLKLHIKNNHTDNPDIFECAHCSKTFRYKRILYLHIEAVHPEAIKGDEYNKDLHTFECFHCSSTFRFKSHLRYHVRKVHLERKQKMKESHFRCLICSNLYRSSKVLNRHYVHVHGVALNYQKLEFDCIQSYEQWLENHQQNTLTRFTIWYRTKKDARLVCHRSGDIRSSLTVDSRKRCLKTSGYKRLGGICPAEIRLHIQEDGKCLVKYQKTHIGHNIGDESELGQIFLTNEEKKIIAAEIQSGVPLAEIVNRKRLSRSSSPGKNISRLGLVTRRDVRNIAVSQNFNFKNCEDIKPRCDKLQCDPTDLEKKIAEHEGDIVFYKRQTEEDTRFSELHREDFALVILTSNQERYLRTYGYKAVCLDVIHCTNPSGFFLHKLSVLDTDDEGLPAAFLLSNRNDQCIVDIFLTCIRNRVGILLPHTVITDMQSVYYYDSWVNIMSNPTYYLFSTWHVHKAWRKNYCKITDKKKRDDVRTELLRLLHELDPIKFENGLNLFLSWDDDELTDFKYYFQENYSSNAQQWAYCYQTMANTNTNMAIESFHRSFKYNLTGGQKIQSLTQCLVLIFDYLTLLETNIFEKNTRGKVTNKLSILRNRHRVAFEQYKEDASSKVIGITSNMYMVQAFSKADTFYTISRQESKDCVHKNNGSNYFASKSCRLVCYSCNLCFHDFRCTCEDSSVRWNMCKHIHLVGLYLRDQPVEYDENKLQCTEDGMNIPVSYVEDNENSSLTIVEEKVFENVARIQNVGDIKKQKYSRLIIEAMQKLQSALSTCTGSKLQSIYNKMKPAILEARCPETMDA